MGRRATARGTLSRALAALREHWLTLSAVALAIFVPLGLLDVLDERFSDLDPDELGTADAIAALVISLSRAVTALVGEIFLSGAVAAAVGEVRGELAHPIRRLARTIPYARLIAITLLFAIGMTIGLLLLVVPGVLFFGLFVLAAPLAEVERLGVRDAFARSRELARGNLVLVLGVLVPLSILAELGGELAQAAGVRALGEGFAGEWAGAVASGLLISMPWALAAVALVYELRDAEAGAGRRAATRSIPPPRR